jgi:hypothetical protein
MTRDDSEWVNGLFAASAADRTPAPASHAARVLYVPVSRDPEASRRCASVLSDIELQRAERFVTEDGKANQIHVLAYFSEILILLRFAANSIPALGPCRASLTPFSFPRLTPPTPPTKAPPPPTEL